MCIFMLSKDPSIFFSNEGLGTVISVTDCDRLRVHIERDRIFKSGGLSPQASGECSLKSLRYSETCVY